MTMTPTVELDDEGRATRARVPSKTREGEFYELVHYPSGWVHDDVDCRGWVENGSCYHVKAMEETMAELDEETRAITVQTSPLALMNDVDLHDIMSASLVPVKEWTYNFDVSGQKVEGISARGVQDAARALSTKGEAIRCTEVILVKEDEDEAYFKAVAGRFAISPDGKEILTDVTIRAKRQPKWIETRSGGKQFNKFWYEIGTTKAARNAIDALLPEALRAFMKSKARTAPSSAQVAQEAKRPGSTGTAAKPAAKPSAATTPLQQATADSNPRRDVAMLLQEMQDTTDDEFQAQAYGALRREFPDAFPEGTKFIANKINEDDARSLAERMRVTLRGSGPPAEGEDA